MEGAHSAFADRSTVGSVNAACVDSVAAAGNRLIPADAVR